MRLIDADVLKNEMCENCLDKSKYGRQFCPCERALAIDYAPTAYDVDKVVDELINAEYAYTAEYPHPVFDIDNCEIEESLLKAEMVEDIVRKGAK